MLAGYETTSTVLATHPRVLATDPEEQLKLQQHIDAHFESDNKNDMPSYDTVSQMEYLDMFIRETCRICGTRIAIDMYTLHFDPDLWGSADPHIFYPERFEMKRHQMAKNPFGAGPRNCVGMGFALMELKMAFVSLLKQYLLVNCSDKTNKCFEQL